MDRIDLGTDVEVQLDVFSGRANPRWTLSGERARELGERLTGVEPAEPREPPALGYRGFLISDARIKLRVFDSLLVLHLKGTTSHLRDVGGAEEFLLGQAREHGYGDVLEVFRDEMRPRQGR
jgi:hypothetical protein